MGLPADKPVSLTNIPQLEAEGLRTNESVTLWKTTWRRLFRRKSAMVGLGILIFLILVAFTAPWIAPYDPYKVLIGVEPIKMRQAPCIHLLGCPEDQPQHIMGVDGNVRDQFSRVIFGSRLSLMVGLTTVSFAIVIGR
jgi:peptide/nickel transport system permease protein